MESYFSELEKIANDFMSPEDIAADPMLRDPQPKLDPEEVEAVQAANSVTPTAAEEQLPASPEDVEALELALAEAEGNLAEAKETLAHTEEAFVEFEKVAEAINESLVGMGALARLIDFSTNENVEEPLQKLAHERLTTALKDEESYSEVLTKTAQELFEDQENLELLYSREGMEYVVEHLASFVEDEELEKSASDLTGIVGKARETAGEYLEAIRKLHGISDEINAAKAHVDELTNIATEKRMAVAEARKLGDSNMVSQLNPEAVAAEKNHLQATDDLDHLYNLQSKGRQMMGAGGAGLAAGGLFAGKKIYDSTHKTEEDELSTKVASVTINPEDTANYKGGNIEMSQSIVQDFLKIAGAAFLLDVANDENKEEDLRKEAATAFNTISRMGRIEMEESFVKIAQQAYNEEALHEIVSGKHNEELFDKIAFFTNAYDMSADELEKVAGADGVAAKGVGGALTDAKANIVEKVEADKKKTETVHNGETGSKKADDMRGYNVINNPGEYQVEKTASLIEEAEMRKEAAFKEYVAMDNFIKNNQK